MANDPQVPWTDEQWGRVNQVIQEEAKRARVAATFLPLYGPLPADFRLRTGSGNYVSTYDRGRRSCCRTPAVEYRRQEYG